MKWMLFVLAGLLMVGSLHPEPIPPAVRYWGDAGCE